MDRSTYTTHADLLSQVADSTDERDNVRRILHGLTEDDLDAQERYKRAPFAIGPANHAHRYSTCHGPCDQGRKPCPTFEACECAEPSRPAPSAGDLVRVAALFLGAWAAIALTLVATGFRF